MGLIKVCGLTREADLRATARAGADLAGFQMSRGPRKLAPGEARALVRRTPAGMLAVGVFVDETLERLLQLTRFCGFDVLQLHGAEPRDLPSRLPRPVLRAVRMRRKTSHRGAGGPNVAALLLDRYNPHRAGGTGEAFNWTWAAAAVRETPLPIFLAGGLTPGNVAEAIRRVRPFGVDVASGVETSPGRKDPARVLRFVREARRAFVHYF